ncbi:hypothetical protein FH039_00995 [Thermococcus indicus]|uniref:DUF2238 domain-containing protein n=1 Tax=Thermococcus indicus TaxID=2586643 RepID=A0A4Y5SJU3_9EURY|nr:hypothetical protein [Thermococcus indicus]QDA30472.1 hypothetical protein FH039_00995 [Thermococcus indicus]
MLSINLEEKTVLVSMSVLVIGFFTGLYYRRVDHILRTSWMMAYLLAVLWLPRKHKRQSGTLGVLLSPFYNEGITAITSVFLAVHASLVNVPFTSIDLFNVAFRDVDMISHFLGGLVIWLFLVSILRGLLTETPWRRVLIHSFTLLLVIGVGWEVAEWAGSHFTEGILKETTQNKVRDVLMEQLGALFGLWMVTKKGYPFSPRRG